MGVPQNAVWNLGGKTLSVVFDGNDPDFNMQLGETISNGTFKVIVNATTRSATERSEWWSTQRRTARPAGGGCSSPT